MIALEAQKELNFTAGYSGVLPTFLWRGKGGNTTRTDTMPHDQPNRHNYAATVPLITWQHIAHAVNGTLPQRVLVRTYEHMPVDRWDGLLAAYAPGTIERLADLGVLLVGIDTASIDPADSKTLDSHQVIRRRGLRVLENLVLDAVPEGDYELIALPLKLTTADASPVRAVLRAL